MSPDALQRLDERLFLAVNAWVGSPLDFVFAWPTFLITVPGLAALTAVFMRIWEERDFARRWAAVLLGALAGGAASQTVKLFADRDRPLAALYDAQSGGTVLKSLFGVYVSDSFPSAHTALVFGAAAALSRLHPRLAALFFALAAWLSFSRVYVGAHFVSDVLAGAVLGAAAAMAVPRKAARP